MDDEELLRRIESVERRLAEVEEVLSKIARGFAARSDDDSLEMWLETIRRRHAEQKDKALVPQ